MCVGGNWGHCYSALENLHDEAEISAQSYVGGCFRGSSVTYVCKRPSFSFHIFIQSHLGLHGGFQGPDENGELVGGAVAAEL